MTTPSGVAQVPVPGGRGFENVRTQEICTRYTGFKSVLETPEFPIYRVRKQRSGVVPRKVSG